MYSKNSQRFPKPKMLAWLGWLAKTLKSQQSEYSLDFFIEFIQPSWLPDYLRRNYILLSRVLGGLVLGLCAGIVIGIDLRPFSFLAIPRFDPDKVRYSIQLGMDRLDVLPYGLLTGILVGLFGGLGFAWLDFIKLYSPGKQKRLTCWRITFWISFLAIALFFTWLLPAKRIYRPPAAIAIDFLEQNKIVDSEGNKQSLSPKLGEDIKGLVSKYVEGQKLFQTKADLKSENCLVESQDLSFLERCGFEDEIEQRDVIAGVLIYDNAPQWAYETYIYCRKEQAKADCNTRYYGMKRWNSYSEYSKQLLGIVQIGELPITIVVGILFVITFGFSRRRWAYRDKKFEESKEEKSDNWSNDIQPEFVLHWRPNYFFWIRPFWWALLLATLGFVLGCLFDLVKLMSEGYSFQFFLENQAANLLDAFSNFKDIVGYTEILYWVPICAELGFICAIVFGIIRSQRKGIRQAREDEKLKPKQGIKIAWSNGLRVGGYILGVWGFLGVFIAVTLASLHNLIHGNFMTIDHTVVLNFLVLSVIFALLFAAPGLLSFGGWTVIKHYVLLYRFYRAGYLPWDLRGFLTYGTKLRLLKRIGGSYQFIHGSLRDYLASKFPGPKDH